MSERLARESLEDISERMSEKKTKECQSEYRNIWQKKCQKDKHKKYKKERLQESQKIYRKHAKRYGKILSKELKINNYIFICLPHLFLLYIYYDFFFD